MSERRADRDYVRASGLLRQQHEEQRQGMARKHHSEHIELAESHPLSQSARAYLAGTRKAEVVEAWSEAFHRASQRGEVSRSDGD